MGVAMGVFRNRKVLLNFMISFSVITGSSVDLRFNIHIPITGKNDQFKLQVAKWVWLDFL